MPAHGKTTDFKKVLGQAQQSAWVELGSGKDRGCQHPFQCYCRPGSTPQRSGLLRLTLTGKNHAGGGVNMGSMNIIPEKATAASGRIIEMGFLVLLFLLVLIQFLLFYFLVPSFADNLDKGSETATAQATEG